MYNLRIQNLHLTSNQVRVNKKFICTLVPETEIDRCNKDYGYGNWLINLNIPQWKGTWETLRV
jgi:hypothetical protein